MVRNLLMTGLLLLTSCWCGADGPPRPPRPAPKPPLVEEPKLPPVEPKPPPVEEPKS